MEIASRNSSTPLPFDSCYKELSAVVCDSARQDLVAHTKSQTNVRTDVAFTSGLKFVRLNTFTAIVDLSRSNFSIARAPLFQLKSAT